MPCCFFLFFIFFGLDCGVKFSSDPVVFCLGLFGAAHAQSQTTQEQVTAFLNQVETQIEKITTAKGRFMQISDSGQIVRGDISIARPRRMRFDYDEPSPALLVADGRFIGTYNTKKYSTRCYFLMVVEHSWGGLYH